MSFLTSFRIQLVRKLIHLNEHIYFYPKLKKFYRQAIHIKHPIILDIGSNRGQSIDFFSALFPFAKIYGFEPNKRLYDQLIGSYPTQDFYNVGISNQSGNMVFYENILDETSTLQQVNYESDYARKKAKVLGVAPADLIVDQYEVEVITIAEFLGANNIEHVDILKIDVEGHEFLCLQGLFSPFLKSSIEFIQIENHEDSMYTNYGHQINSLMLENGYVLKRIIKHGFGDFNELIYQKGNPE